MSSEKRRIRNDVIMIGSIVALIVLGVRLFSDRRYTLVSMMIAFLACFFFYLTYEKKEGSIRRMVMIAVMTTITVISRLIFGVVPGFKPMSAIIILTGIFMGPECGFGRIPLCTDFEYFLWTGAMDSVSDADMGNHRISVRTSGAAKSAAQPHTADNLGHADGNAVFRYYGYLDSAGSDRCVVLETVSDGTEYSCTIYYCLYVIQCGLFDDWIKTVG